MIYEIFVQALSLIFTSPALTKTIQIGHASHSCEGLGLVVNTKTKMIANATIGKKINPAVIFHRQQTQ
jgi:hypothetical protein